MGKPKIVKLLASKTVLAALLIACTFFMGAPQAFAAISFVNSFENSSSPNTDTTVTLSGLQQDDLVIVAASFGDTDGVNVNMTINTAGYTKIEDLFSDSGSQDVNFGVWYKFMGSTPDTSVVVEGNAGTGTNSSLAVEVMAFRGVDTTTPFDVASTSTTGTGSPHPDPPPIDHNNPSGVWIVIAGADVDLFGGATSYTFPTGYTTNKADRAHNDTFDTTVGIGYRSSGVSDPEDPGVMTNSGGTNAFSAWAAVTMALRPAGSGSVPTVTNSTGESDVTATGAAMNGDVTSDGGSSVTARGFAWGTNATLSGGDTSTTTNGTGTGAFSQSVINLISGQTYYYRAYATNSSGTGYASAIEPFTTGTDSTVSRSLRLFGGFILKLFGGTLKLYAP